MTDKAPLIGIAGVNSVNAALNLLREKTSKSGKRRRKEKKVEDAEDRSENKVVSHCTSHQRHSPIYKEKTNAALGFSENHALTEMRVCLANHDWTGLRQLFPLILGCYGELEPVVWRYIFIILLCTPQSDSAHLRQFLEMCVGAQTLEDGEILDRLLTLPRGDS